MAVGQKSQNLPHWIFYIPAENEGLLRFSESGC